MGGGAFINPENLNSNIYSQNFPPPNPLVNSIKGFQSPNKQFQNNGNESPHSPRLFNNNDKNNVSYDSVYSNS